MKIETERLILRRFELSDLDALAPIMADPDVMHFSKDGPWPRERTQRSPRRRRLPSSCGPSLWIGPISHASVAMVRRDRDRGTELPATEPSAWAASPPPCSCRALAMLGRG